jgi:CubicO group peptidase (beta-lactamase class C family)
MRVRTSVTLVVVSIALGCGAPRDDRSTGAGEGDRSAESRRLHAIASAETELVQSIDTLIGRLVATDDFSGVLLVWRQWQPLLERAVGLADRERHRAHAIDTPFALASVSKMFTAVIVAQLAEQKRISFNATIGSLLPNYRRRRSPFITC